MVSNTDSDKETSDDNPLNEFSGCHEGIFENFRQLQAMLEMLDQANRADEVRVMAKAQLDFFKNVVLEHHAEEEQELFTAVMDSATEGDEASQARQTIKRLVEEHRNLEALWASIEGDVRRLAKGKPAELDRETAGKLAKDYLAGAVLLEIHDEWQVASRRYLSEGSMALLDRLADDDVSKEVDEARALLLAS